ncbi:MAG: phosphoglucosamine mutase [Candidatus Micrarchaeia archaeon]
MDNQAWPGIETCYNLYHTGDPSIKGLPGVEKGRAGGPPIKGLPEVEKGRAGGPSIKGLPGVEKGRAGGPSFGTNGVRGTLEDITPDFVARLCASFGTWTGSNKVLVARDTRTTGELVECAAVSGLLWSGVQPVLLGILPTPVVEYLSKKHSIPSIVITSSHNPPEWVALKFNDENGVALSKERGKEVEGILEMGAWKRVGWKEIPKVLEERYMANEYVEEVKGLCGCRLEGMKIIVDCGNGTVGRIVPQMLKDLGAHVVTLNAQEDGFFPGRNSEPTEQNVQDLVNAMKIMGADAGLAYDGDGDRLAIVDEKGGYILGDKVFALGAEIALEESQGDVVTTVATSNIIKEVAERHGRKVKYVKVGAPYIAEEMLRGRYATGGEEVGGVIWPKTHYGKDGIITALKILCWIKTNNLRLSEAVGRLPKYYNVKIKLSMGNERFDVINRLRDKWKNEKNAIVIDGVRIDFDDGWCIARASGTEDYIRIFGEAKSEGRARELVEFMNKEVMGFVF